MGQEEGVRSLLLVEMIEVHFLLVDLREAFLLQLAEVRLLQKRGER